MTRNGVRQWGPVAGALLMLGAIAAPARADETVVAKVPFAFIVGDRSMPAGDYTVRETSEAPAVVSIESLDGRRTVLALTNPDSLPSAAEHPALVFRKFENQYFLSRISGDGSGREILLTTRQMEKELRTTAAD